MAHNYYRQAGGEDVVFLSEQRMLQDRGHEVFTYIEDNQRISGLGRVGTAVRSIWSQEAYRAVKAILRRDRPDLVHFHNTFPLISPSAYYACGELGIPVVQTLHNYRLICPSAILFRSGVVCEECVRKIFPYPAMVHRCYHGSALHSGVVSTSVFVHNALKTWKDKVDAYIALTQFSKSKFVHAGIPSEKIFVKPNFVSIADDRRPQPTGDDAYFMFVGRSTPEKGITTLLEAWERLQIPLYIFGGGVIDSNKNSSYLRFMNLADRQTIFTYMKNARALVFPSQWYEGFPVVLAEAFANSLPVIASNVGSQAEIVRDGYSGLHFRSGDSDDLRAKIEWLLAHFSENEQMRRNARREYDEKYTPETNYLTLMDIYDRVINSRA